MAGSFLISLKVSQWLLTDPKFAVLPGIPEEEQSSVVRVANTPPGACRGVFI